MRWLVAAATFAAMLFVGVIYHRRSVRASIDREREIANALAEAETAKAAAGHRAQVDALERRYQGEAAAIVSQSPERAADLRSNPRRLARALVDLARRGEGA